jgi:hypothetical protein
MTRMHPAPDCHEVSFTAGCAMGEAAEVALEDYAREMTRALGSEAVRGQDSRVGGVHLCGLAEPVGAGASRDIEDFARSLAAPEAGGLGWS